MQNLSGLGAGRRGVGRTGVWGAGQASPRYPRTRALSPRRLAPRASSLRGDPGRTPLPARRPRPVRGHPGCHLLLPGLLVPFLPHSGQCWELPGWGSPFLVLLLGSPAPLGGWGLCPRCTEGAGKGPRSRARPPAPYPPVVVGTRTRACVSLRVCYYRVIAVSRDRGSAARLAGRTLAVVAAASRPGDPARTPPPGAAFPRGRLPLARGATPATS